jgi:hypothetical protein
MYRKLLETAGKASSLLGKSAEQEILAYLEGIQKSDGGFPGRNATAGSDIYYTMYAAMIYAALTGGIPKKLEEYIKSIAAGKGLDFIHTCALIRMYALISGKTVGVVCREFLQESLVEYRSADGGFSHSAKFAEYGTPYGAFLAASAYEEMQAEIPEKEFLTASVLACQTTDNGFANMRSSQCGTANAAAAALAYLAVWNQLNGIPDGIHYFIMMLYADNGGFRASEVSPFADLLSTGALLFAMSLAGLSMPVEKAAATLEMIEGCWTDSGGFKGHTGDSIPDCEYTFYALLAVGAIIGI